MAIKMTRRHKGGRLPTKPKASRAIDLPPPLTPEQIQAAIALLSSWRDVDDEGAREQRETMEYLRKALDEDRPPGYKLFSQG